MQSQPRKRIMIGVAGGALTLAAAIGGVALAQTPGTGTNPSATPSAAQPQRQAQHQAQKDQFLSDLAKNLGVDRSKLDSALKTTATDEIDAAVQSGKLTQDQANQMKQAIANGNVPFGIDGARGGRGDFGKGVPANVRQAAQDAVTGALKGETPDQVRTKLQAGETPDQIAQEAGTTVQAVQNAVVSAVQPLLDQAVQGGSVTAAQEQQLLTTIKNGKGFGFGVRAGGHRGMAAPGRAATPSAAQ